jgi:hypothetical protein
MVNMQFRKEMWEDLPLRIADFIGHALMAWLIPGPFWSQYLPELVGPICLIHGLRTNKIMSQSNPLIKIQNFLHTIYPVLGLVVLALVLSSEKVLWMSIQYFSHILWDQCTHEKAWQKRSLWSW